MKSNFGNRSVGKKFRGAPGAFRKAEGLDLNGGSEQRGSGWCQSGNKPACFECENTDRFKDQRPIRLAKAKVWANTQPSSTKKGEMGRKAERGNATVNQLGFLTYEQAKMHY